MDTSVSASQIDWALNKEKALDRENTIGEIIHTLARPNGRRKRTFDVLSLPGRKWIFERAMADIMNTAKFTFYGLDFDEKEFVVAKQLAGRLSKIHDNAVFKMATRKKTSVGDYLYTKPSTKFDIVYLDWMGTWSQKKKEAITFMFDCGILKPDSHLAMTFGYPRGQVESMGELRSLAESTITVHFKSASSTIDPESPKTKGLTLLLSNMAVKYGYRIDPVSLNTYAGHSGSTQITLLYSCRSARRRIK